MRHTGLSKQQGQTDSLRVLHLGKFYPPVRGGIEQVTFDLAEGAHRRGVVTTVLCFGDQKPLADDSARGYEVLRANTFGVLASQPLSLAYFWLLLKHHWREQGRYLIHLHVPNPLAALFLLLLPRRPRFIVHWHSDIVNQTGGASFFSPIEQALLHSAEAVIVTSAAYLDESLPLKRWHHKTHLIPLGIEDLPIAANGSKAVANHVEGKFTILAVGRLVSYKGFESLIQAMAQLPESHYLHLVGTGPLEASLKDLVARLNVGHRVMFLGGINRQALTAEYRQCSLFCLPSVTRAEAFGVVLLEAMSAGKPIVATRIAGSGTQWVNVDGVTGYNVTAGDVAALAAAVKKITESSVRAAEMGAAARSRYLEHFTAGQMVESVMALYRRCST